MAVAAAAAAEEEEVVVVLAEAAAAGVGVAGKLVVVAAGAVLVCMGVAARKKLTNWSFRKWHGVESHGGNPSTHPDQKQSVPA